MSEPCPHKKGQSHQVSAGGARADWGQELEGGPWGSGQVGGNRDIGGGGEHAGDTAQREGRAMLPLPLGQ